MKKDNNIFCSCPFLIRSFISFFILHPSSLVRQKNAPRFTLYVLLLTLITLQGCITSEYNLATKQEEYYLISTDKEIRMGEAVAEKIEEAFIVVPDVDINERVESILDDIVAVCDRRDIVYFIKVIEDEEVPDVLNAVSLPGGYIYIFKGVLDAAESDDELAGVIAHEVAHITTRHGVKRTQGAYAALALQVASTQANGSVAAGVNLALNSLFSEYSQQDEFEADRLSIKYMRKAGYDPSQMIVFLKRLEQDKAHAKIRMFSYWKTHPFITKRISAANQEISGKLEFEDYLNLTEGDY